MGIDEQHLLASDCEVRESILTNGPAAGSRQIEIRAPGGIDLRILPDRGFGIMQAWRRGRPLAWVDPNREAPPVSNLHGAEWLRTFAGGLLTTCGLRHVGQPNEEHGLHGRFSHQRALVRSVEVSRADSCRVVSASALIVEPDSLGPLLELSRTIATAAGMGRVEVRDVLANCGYAFEPVELLYHVNLSYRHDMPPSISVEGEPVGNDQLDKAQETVALPVPQASWVSVQMRSKRSATVLSLLWDTSVLSYLYLWMYPTSDEGGILAVEPSTKPLLGEVDGPSSALEVQPGECVVTGLTVRVNDLESDA